MKQIDWNKFTITDNLLFQRVMRDKNLCKYLIEHILNIRIRDIQYLETEKTLSGSWAKKESVLTYIWKTSRAAF